MNKREKTSVRFPQHPDREGVTSYFMLLLSSPPCCGFSTMRDCIPSNREPESTLLFLGCFCRVFCHSTEAMLTNTEPELHFNKQSKLGNVRNKPNSNSISSVLDSKASLPVG